MGCNANQNKKKQQDLNLLKVNLNYIKRPYSQQSSSKKCVVSEKI